MKKEKHPNHVKCPRCGLYGTKNFRKRKSRDGSTFYGYYHVVHPGKRKACYIGKVWPMPLLIHLPPQYIEELDSLVPYPDRYYDIMAAVRDLLRAKRIASGARV